MLLSALFIDGDGDCRAFAPQSFTCAAELCEMALLYMHDEISKTGRWCVQTAGFGGFKVKCKTSPQFTALSTGNLPPVALSCNHQCQQSSS
jgi:hypothetical protein